MISIFFNKLRKAFNIPALRDRIYYTLTMALVVRAGFHVPIPGVNVEQVKGIASEGFLGFVNLLSGGALAQASIFALGIYPYISASIGMHILTLMFPRLEEMQKEGGVEREKLSQWTRYGAIVLTILQSSYIIANLQMASVIESPGLLFYVNTIILLTTSMIFLTWVGDQITANGIGNGISIIIFIGIVSRLPSAIYQFVNLNSGNRFFFLLVGAVATFIFTITAAIVLFQLAQRKVPIYYSSTQGSSMAAGSYLPIKMNSAGVMPIIFAGMVQSGIVGLLSYLPEAYRLKISSFTRIDGPIMLTVYFLLVLMFTFFYTSVIFDPEKIAENLKKSGGSIKGVRPGRETAEYLDNIIVKITLGGAFFLASLAVLPFFVGWFFGSSFSIGGTSILIAVGVAIEVLQQVESALSMENYREFI